MTSCWGRGSTLPAKRAAGSPVTADAVLVVPATEDRWADIARILMRLDLDRGLKAERGP